MAKARKNCLLCARSMVSPGEIRCQKRRCAVDQHEAITCKTYKPDYTPVGSWNDVIPQVVSYRTCHGSRTVRI